MTYFLPNGVYDVLKWLGLVACPAIAVFYGVVAPLWGWPAPENVVTTINALGVLIGVLIGASAVTAKPADAQIADVPEITVDEAKAMENDLKGM